MRASIRDLFSGPRLSYAPASSKNEGIIEGWSMHARDRFERRKGQRAAPRLSYLLVVQRLTFPFPFVHHRSHDWKAH